MICVIFSITAAPVLFHGMTETGCSEIMDQEMKYHILRQIKGKHVPNPKIVRGAIRFLPRQNKHLDLKTKPGYQEDQKRNSA
jgi:hypothetical protein